MLFNFAAENNKYPITETIIHAVVKRAKNLADSYMIRFLLFISNTHFSYLKFKYASMENIKITKQIKIHIINRESAHIINIIDNKINTIPLNNIIWPFDIAFEMLNLAVL